MSARPGDAGGVAPPRVIAWEVTRSCNLACVHCRASAVFSSPSYGPWIADARQWTQARLQLRVTSQATTRGGVVARTGARRRATF